jgi:TRAP-type C4-dicarboxylate transport system permease small subunit
MWLSRAASLLNRVICPVVELLHTVGMGVLALMMFLTASDVILRYAFNRPIVGDYDLTEYMMAILVSFGLAYCAFMKGHVRVDLIVNHLPQRLQAVIDSITGLLSIFLFAIITWQSFVYMVILYRSGIESTVLLIPRFPFTGLVCLGSAFLTLVLVVEFIDSLSRAVQK